MKKVTGALAAFAVVLFILIVARVESKVFVFSPSQQRIQGRIDVVLKTTQESRSKLESVYAVAEDPKQFVLVDPVLEREKQQQATDGSIVKMDSLRVTGSMTAGGVWSAIVNGSLVRAGDNVRGFDVVDVNKSGVVFLIGEKNVLVAVNEEVQVEKVKTGRLTLDEVVSGDGVNTAIINGRPYKAGDWIDGETQVKAIAPSVVMLVVNGQSKMLRVGQTL